MMYNETHNTMSCNSRNKSDKFLLSKSEMWSTKKRSKPEHGGL